MLAIGTVDCGIEVGNPSDDDDDDQQAKITIELADAPIDDAAQVLLDIAGFSLIASDGQLHELELTEAFNEPVDILKLQDGLTEVLASENIPVGQYLGYIFSFNSKRIGQLIQTDGTEKTIFLPVRGKNIVEVSEAFEISADTTTILHFDLQQSLIEIDGAVILDPLILAVPKEKSSVVSGKVTLEDRAVVCAYLSPDSTQTLSETIVLEPLKVPGRPGLRRPPPSDEEKHQARGPRRGPPPAGEANLPCKGAISSAFVGRDGTFRIHFLPENSYQVLVFTKSRKIYQFSDVINVSEASTKEIGDITSKITLIKDLSTQQ